MKIDNSLTDQLMVLAAHQYCLGRRSYITGVCQDWLRVCWDMFEAHTKKIIVRDTIEALLRSEAGDIMDAVEWQKFVQWAKERISPDDWSVTQRQVSHLKDRNPLVWAKIYD